MNYDNKFDKQWQNTGTQPADDFFLSTGGFKGKQKPPAQWFNWFWHKVIASITELQTKLSSVDTKADSKANKQNASGGFGGGIDANAGGGGAIGFTANTIGGGAVGCEAISENGFSGGYNAKTLDSDSAVIDAIQLGTGTNRYEKTLQIYDYQLMDADGNVPKARLSNAQTVFYIAFPTITLGAQSTKDYKTSIIITPSNYMLIRLKDGNTAGLTYVSGVSYYTYTGSNYSVAFNSDGTIHFSNSGTSSVTISNLVFLVIEKNQLTVTEV